MSGTHSSQFESLASGVVSSIGDAGKRNLMIVQVILLMVAAVLLLTYLKRRNARLAAKFTDTMQ